LTRAAIYTRVSTDEQAAEGYSLADQEQQALAKIGREGWTHVGTYSDAGLSGANRDRPALSRLLADLDGIDVLVLAALDRLGRDMFHLGELFERFKDASVRVESLRETIADDGSAGSFLGRGMVALFADYERRIIRERTKAGVIARVRKGGYHGSFTPMGYKRNDGGLVIVRAEASIVRRIFREYLAGVPQLQIARALNRERVPTRRGGKWSSSTIRDLLRNPVFVGKVRISGEVHDGTHRPIIERKTWDRAKALLDANVDTAGTRARRRGNYLLIGGLLRCGECGEALTPSTQKNPKAPPRETYRCNGRGKHGSDFCSQGPISRAAVDSAVRKHFARVGLSIAETRNAVERASTAQRTEVVEQRERAEKEVSSAKAALARVRRDYTRGAISAEDWSDLRPDLEEELRAAVGALTLLKKQEAAVLAAANVGDVEKRVSELKEALAADVQDAESVEAVRAALQRIYSKFTFHRPGTIDLDDLYEGNPFLDATSAAGEGVIVVEPRPDAVLGLGDYEQPVLRREPLEQAGSRVRRTLVQL
jgi:site-specific DNA recombinase